MLQEKCSVSRLTLPAAANFDAPRVPVHVECVLKPEAAISREDIHSLRLSVGSLIVRSSARDDGATMIRNGEFTIPPDDLALSACARVRVVDVEEPSGVVAVSAELSIDCYFEDDSLPECEYVSEGDEDLPAFNAWALPSARLDGVWESLIFESRVKRHLMDYTTTAMLFSDAGVDRRLVTFNRIILLHGPPGTGKTSLCRALAHKAAIRLSDRYSNSHLLEINAHSLFSKWFSESGKLVLRLFQHVHELVEDDDAFVVLLIDEVESLTASRSASGSEPSDSLRVVNAVLTQLDGLSQHPNVLVLATSNLSGAIDGAFLDRADLKLFIGPPGLRARFEILRSCFAELVRAGIVTAPAGRLAPYIAEFAALPEPAKVRGHRLDGQARLDVLRTVWADLQRAFVRHPEGIGQLAVLGHGLQVEERVEDDRADEAETDPDLPGALAVVGSVGKVLPHHLLDVLVERVARRPLHHGGVLARA